MILIELIEKGNLVSGNGESWLIIEIGLGMKKMICF